MAFEGGPSGGLAAPTPLDPQHTHCRPPRSSLLQDIAAYAAAAAEQLPTLQASPGCPDNQLGRVNAQAVPLFSTSLWHLLRMAGHRLSLVFLGILASLQLMGAGGRARALRSLHHSYPGRRMQTLQRTGARSPKLCTLTNPATHAPCAQVIVNRMRARLRIDEARVRELLSGLRPEEGGADAYAATVARLLGCTGDLLTVALAPGVAGACVHRLGCQGCSRVQPAHWRPAGDCARFPSGGLDALFYQHSSGLR